MKNRGVYLKLRWCKDTRFVPAKHYRLAVNQGYIYNKNVYCLRLVPVWIPKEFRGSIDRLFVYSSEMSYILNSSICLTREDGTDYDSHDEPIGKGLIANWMFPNLTRLAIGKFWIKVYNFYLTLIFSSLLNRGDK